MTLETTDLLITSITFFIVYLVMITICNIFRAWVAGEMGDSTGIRLGYLTLNPLYHIDPFGLIFLFIFHFGWGQTVPINPLMITEPYRTLKLFLAYLSDTCMHFVLSVVGMIALLAIFDVDILRAIIEMVIYRSISQMPIADMYPDLSSWVISIGFIIFSFVYLNVVIGVLSFIINFSHWLLFILADRSDRIAGYANYITLGLCVFLMLFFAPIFRLLAVHIISFIGLVVARTLGIA